MSLNRLCLRLAAVAALTRKTGRLWPTSAESRVFDGRMAPIREVFQAEGAYPVILVDTPYHKGLMKTQAPAEDCVVDLAFELSIHIAARDDEGDGFKVGVPLTDSELATSLDLMEAELHRVLEASDIFKAIVQGYVESESALAQPEEGQRFAVRYVLIRAKLLRDHFSGQVPQHIAPLLAALDLDPAYAARSAAIRAVFTSPAESRVQRLLKDLRWTAVDADQLGHHTGEPFVFPEEIRPLIALPSGVADDDPSPLT